jgi:hypothetical protein
LAVPLSIHKLKKDLQPLIDKVSAGLPTWKEGLMSCARRAVLVKTKMSAMPVHTAIVVVISPWVIQMIDKRQRAFLWKGTTSVSGGHCKVARPSVCKPPELGGLGLSNLELMGYALRLRWMCHKKTGTNKHWIALPEKMEQQLSNIFHYSTTVNVGDGTSMLFLGGQVARWSLDRRTGTMYHSDHWP